MANRIFSFVRNTALAAASAALLLLPLAPQARASEWNQRTLVTFNQPVEIPGRVLTPGTYVFKLANSTSNLDIVQIFNKNDTRLIATEMTIPVYRLNPPDHTSITVSERPVGTPEAVHEWFYPGNNFGHEFVYSR